MLDLGLLTAELNILDLRDPNFCVWFDSSQMVLCEQAAAL
jgi:hypothetical protein